MCYRNLFMALISGIFGLVSQAQGEFSVTDAEIANLPTFCAARYKGGADYRHWLQIMGKDFGHTHHYCNALNFINRYYRSRSPQDKSFNLNNALNNLNYMVAHASPTYSLMPDVYLNLGVVYSLMNKPAESITHFNKAVELDPRQPRAYGALADYYVKSKQNVKALEIVSTGLRYNPNMKSLQRRYTELGGKLPYPAPIDPAPVEAQEVKLDGAVAGTPANPDVPIADTPATVTPAAESIAPPKIGSPTNPYCRFCPD